MQTFASQIDDYLKRYREGDVDEAFHGLLELDDGCLKDMIEAFWAEADNDVRSFLLLVIRQHRQQSLIPFLGKTLFDSDPRVWQEALDGLVTLASPAAVEALQAARARQFSKAEDTEEFRHWLEEAIEQADIGA